MHFGFFAPKVFLNYLAFQFFDSTMCEPEEMFWEKRVVLIKFDSKLLIALFLHNRCFTDVINLTPKNYV